MATRSEKILTLAVLFAILGAAGVWVIRYNHNCSKTDQAFETRIARLKTEIAARIRVGMKKDDVLHFLADEGMKVTVRDSKLNATIETDGRCAMGCSFGPRPTLIVVHIQFDQRGIVSSEPQVESKGLGDCM